MRNVLISLLAIAAGSLIFVGLPLLGWGVTSARLFFDHPARLMYAILIIALQIPAVAYYPPTQRTKGTRRSGLPRHKVDLVLVQLLSVAIVLGAPYTDGHGEAGSGAYDGLRYAGLLLVAVGFVLMALAEKQLAGQFTVDITLVEGHRVVTSGVFRWIRHPRYLGIVLFFGGFSAVFASLAAAACLLGLTGVLAWRIITEEALLAQEFGEEWRAYTQRSWRVIPFIV